MPGMIASEIFEKYARISVPRYTSYPTAPHFRPNFPEARYREWLAQLDPDEPVSLYLHIPFCRKMCWYCGCNMKLAYRREPIAEYISNLLTEIDLVADAMPARMKVSHLHFGGGTPTVLNPEQLETIMSRLRERYSLATHVEASIECDPRTVKKDTIDAIGSLGFTRASFGVQEFDPLVQSAINRIQPPEMVEDTVRRFRAAGVHNINFDLIYGLPKQTVKSIRSTIERCVAMQPDRLALFGYAHVPWFAANQRKIDNRDLPDAMQRHAMFVAAKRTLADAGYAAIGLDHFALPADTLAIAARTGKLHRNFQGYTADSAHTVVGLGASSIGTTPSGYVQNVAETGAWARGLKSGLLPIARGYELSSDDKLRAAVIEQVMCQGKADLVTAARNFGISPDWYADALPLLRSLAVDGVLTCTGGKLLVAEDASALVRVVASAFDKFLTSEVRHAVAV